MPRGKLARADEARRKAADEARRQAAARAAAEEVIPPLRLLGFGAEEARLAAALCETIPRASLEQRVRLALSYFHPRPRTLASAATGPEGASKRPIGCVGPALAGDDA